MAMNRIVCITIALFTGLSIVSVVAAENLVTVRLGEQDTCKYNGVTTVTCDAKKGNSIRFDLSKLTGTKNIKQALLRMWVDMGHHSPTGKAFGLQNWGDPNFDGFKVWQVGKEDKPLDAVFPFFSESFACHEWNVTPAVQAWLDNPVSNQGLRTNFPLADNSFEPAWQRPYLQVTYEGNAVGRPAQPSDLEAFYRSGQVFLTWKQIPYDGAFFDSTYRVYMHSEPITVANLEHAQLLGEVHKLSQLNYRRTIYHWDGWAPYGAYPFYPGSLHVAQEPGQTRAEYLETVAAKIPKRTNFVIDDTWPSQIEGGKWLTDAKLVGEGSKMLEGPQLADDTGLFVHTVKQARSAFFAVTTVVEGWENRQDFTAGNAMAAPIELKIEQPRAVLQAVFNDYLKRGYSRQWREYAYWGGGEDDLHNTPSTPFHELIYMPRQLIGFDTYNGGPVSVCLGADNILIDWDHIPPTRLAPFPDFRVSLYQGITWREGWRYYYGSHKPPSSESETGGIIRRYNRIFNSYGYGERMNTGLDPRKGLVQPYFENRAVRQLDSFLAEFPVCRDQVMIRGQGTAFNLGIHHAELFGSISAAQESPWSSNSQDCNWPMVGKREWQLKNKEGFNVWEWNDPVWYARKFPDLAWPFVHCYQSDNYAKADNMTHWRNCGYPEFYLDLAKDRRGGRWWWGTSGDAPDGKGWPMARNVAYPAFTNVNFCEIPNEIWRDEPRGTLNGYLEWGAFNCKEKKVMSTDSVDQPTHFEMDIRIGDKGITQNGSGCIAPTRAKFGKTDITLWRLQLFKVEKCKKYLWINKKVATGQLLQCGFIEPDGRNLLTVPSFLVDRDLAGNKLIIEPAEGKELPKVVETSQVGNLSYTDYIRKCEKPLTSIEVKAPATVIKPMDFVTPPSGDICSWMGSFGGFAEIRFEVPKTGQYLISVRAKATPALNSWPVLYLNPTIANTGLSKDVLLGRQLVDSADWAFYRWFMNLKQGRNVITIGYDTMDTILTLQLPELAKRTLHVADVTITPLDEGGLETNPVDIRISPRAPVGAKGMPIQFSARVLNGLGKPMDAKVQWKCEGANIDGNGLLTPTNSGKLIVTANIGELCASTSVLVGDKFADDFDEGNAYIRECWRPFDLTSGGNWTSPTAPHPLPTSLWQMQGATRSALVWMGGTHWRDYTVQADVILFGQPGDKQIHGLVARAKDKDNFYRLEIERHAERSSARIILRQNGTERELAREDKAPELAPFDWKTNRLCTAWHSFSEAQAKEKGLNGWRLDRVRFQAKGNALQAWINGQELFPGGVRDGSLSEGAAGLYTENKTVFDNFEVEPAK